MRMLSQLCVAAVVSGIFAGCGGGAAVDKDRPATTKVSGTVTFKGSPVEGAMVTLHPTAGGHGAFGKTDASGKYVLETFMKGDGAVPGDYKVSIVKMESTGPTTQPTMDDPNYDPNAKEEPPKHLLPQKYSKFTESGLNASVGQEAKTDLNFDLVE